MFSDMRIACYGSLSKMPTIISYCRATIQRCVIDTVGGNQKGPVSLDCVALLLYASGKLQWLLLLRRMRTRLKADVVVVVGAADGDGGQL